MNHKDIADLRKDYKQQREFPAKVEGYYFDILSDLWILDYKRTIKLDWMAHLEKDTFIDIRLAIAHASQRYSHGSMQTFISTLKNHIINHLSPHEFKAWWLTLDSFKKNVKDCLQALCINNNSHQSVTLEPLYNLVKEERLGREDLMKGILNEESGAYSNTEVNNILEALRIETANILKGSVDKVEEFLRLRNIISCHLLVAIVRRPTQLAKIKWCDILPVGNDFTSHKESNRKWVPLTQHRFSDIEQFHLRTFRGKDGQFRYDAESRSHRLSPELSELLIQYYKIYKSNFRRVINKLNIELTNQEIETLMKCLPLQPDKSIFSTKFTCKKELFSAFSNTSKAFHVSSDSISNGIRYLFTSVLKVKSDRIPTKPLNLGSNRWRHTQLSQAVLMGLSPAQIAAITGVTVEAIYPYLDLKFQERITIDKAYAGNRIIHRFDSISVEELKQHKDFSVKSPFDEEIGYKLNPSNCSSCQSKGGVPMACYPCDNFRPLETANHKQYLDKAKRKLAINSQSAHPFTIKRLQMVVLYIEATIAICEERKTLKIGDSR